MPTKETIIWVHECLRCGHKWLSKNKRPKICPNRHCHSAYWDCKQTRKKAVKS